MKQSLDDIAELAEDLGNDYFFRGRVNPKRLAKDKGITFIKGNYNNHFLGQLVHSSNKFYIVLNSDLLSICESGRIRFTIAHELGHFFIDNHRIKLLNGISISFNGNLSKAECRRIELEANHFAANILMPKKHFIKLAKKYEVGMRGILVLKTKFDTSIESTTMHYINQDLSPSIMIKWKKDFTFHYAWYSKSFSQLTGIEGYPSIKINTKYIQKQLKIIEQGDNDCIEAATTLSRWYSTISPGASIDLTGLEQTVRLGEYGGITFVTF